MLKKIAIAAILMTLLISGNLFAIDKEPLFIQVIAQEEVDWTLYIDDPLPGQWKIEEYGNFLINATGCQGCPYEMWALDETHFIESGYLPFTDWFEIYIPITVPSWKDPEE